MISKEQIERVHALGRKWNVTDPVKQHAKMGEELGEYLEAKDQLSTRKREKMKSEMGDMWFTLILLCNQIEVDFLELYKGALGHDIEPFETDNQFIKIACGMHFELGGDLLKNRISRRQISYLIRCWLNECATKFISPAEALESVLIKNENKAGKTVNGTFIKEQDLNNNHGK